MENLKNEPKLPDMVMCGDHPFFGKVDLNMVEKSHEKDKPPAASYTKITATASRTGVSEIIRPSESEAALRVQETRRRLQSLEIIKGQEGDVGTPHNRALVQGMGPHCEVLAEAALRSLEGRGYGRVNRTNDAIVPNNRVLMQAALGSFRWPPYLLCVWVAVLVLTHLLHCLVTVLERMLPNLRKFCHYFKMWTEEAWLSDNEPNRMFPVALAFITVFLYTIYFSLYVMYTVAFWSIEPLCADAEGGTGNEKMIDVKIGCESSKACCKR